MVNCGVRNILRGLFELNTLHYNQLDSAGVHMSQLGDRAESAQSTVIMRHKEAARRSTTRCDPSISLDLNSNHCK